MRNLIFLFAGAASIIWCLQWLTTQYKFGAFESQFAPPAKNVLHHAHLQVFPTEAPLTILFVGTSLTARKAWPHDIASQLAACRKGGVQARIIAKPGASSNWGAQALSEFLENPDASGTARPNLVIAEFSINDSSRFRGLPLEESRRQHDKLIELVGMTGTPLYLITLSPAYGRAAKERPGLEAYLRLYWNLAQNHGIGIISTTANWRSIPENMRESVIPDGLHPTDEAYELIVVPAVTDALRPYFCPGSTY